MSDYPPDLGGAFASDAHRRVMAHLPNPDDDPITVEDLIRNRINRDPHTLQHFGSADELITVLGDLEGDGHAENTDDGWRNTPDGFDILTGPPTMTDAAPLKATIGLDPASVNGEG